MDNIWTKLNWKILLAITVVLFTLVVIFSFGRSNSTPTSKPEPAADATITPTTAPKAGWKVYTEYDYSLSFPYYLTASSETEGGIKSLELNDAKDPNFDLNLESASDTRTSVEKISEIFKSFGYQESVVSVDGLPAKKFNGTLKIRNKNLQEIAVVFGKSGQIYKLQLSYDALERNKDFDNLFSQVLETLHFSH